MIAKRRLILATVAVLMLTSLAWAVYEAMFNPRVLYSTGKGPLDIVAAFVDDDEFVDLVVANRNDNSLTIRFGDGDGGFDDEMTLDLPDLDSPPYGPVSLVATDFDDDGITDLVVTQCQNACNQGSFVFLRGFGNGDFAEIHRVDAGKAPYNVSVGDFNQDGVDDFAATDYPSDQVIVLASGGAGYYDDPIFLPTGNQPIALVVADLNGDGSDDIITSNHSPTEGTSTIYFSQASGGSGEPESYELGPLPYSIALGQLNPEVDDYPDLAVAHSTEQGYVSIHLGDGKGGFEWVQDIQSTEPLIFVELADIDEDDVQDIVVMNVNRQFAEVFFNDGRGDFEPEPFLIPSENRIYSAAIEDFNGDGVLDIASVDFELNTLFIAIATHP